MRISYSDEQINIASTFAGISHPSRVQILQFVAKNGKMRFKEIKGKIHLAPATISQHLTKMQKCGVVSVIKGGKKGKTLYYIINPSNVKNINRALDFFTMIHLSCENDQFFTQ